MMRALIPFDEIVPGLEIEPWELAVHEHTAARLLQAVGELPGDHVTPVLGGNLGIGLAFRIIPRNILHTRQSINVRGEVEVGDTLRASAKVTEVFTRRGRACIAIEGAVLRLGGDEAWTFESEFMVPGAPVDGRPERDSAPLELPADVEMLAERTCTLTLEDMIAFSGRHNFHSDREIAQSFGYEAPVAQGMHLGAIALTLLPGLGAAWPDEGQCDLRFIGQVLEGDEIVARAGRVSGDSEVWLSAELASEGTPVLVGRSA